MQYTLTLSFLGRLCLWFKLTHSRPIVLKNLVLKNLVTLAAILILGYIRIKACLFYVFVEQIGPPGDPGPKGEKVN